MWASSLRSAEPREVHHFALLIGYGAGAVNPYLALETLNDVCRKGTMLKPIDYKTAEKNYIKALHKGALKVMSKMGISTLQSYRGAQIFEAVGLKQEFVDKYFAWTPSRIGGIGVDEIETETRNRHYAGYPKRGTANQLDLKVGGMYQWRRDGEYHMYNPDTIALLQYADPQRQLRELPAVHRPDRPREQAPVHDPRPARVQGRQRDPARRGRAGEGHRQALRHRRRVARLDQP